MFFRRKKPQLPSTEIMLELTRSISEPIPETWIIKKVMQEYRELQSKPIEADGETAQRLLRLITARPDEIADIVGWYDNRISQAEDNLVKWVRRVRDALSASGISWHVDASYLLEPSIWQDKAFGNTLIYGLGFTPHDPWNRIFMVDNIVASKDLGLPIFDRERQRSVAEGFRQGQRAKFERRHFLDQQAERTGDMSELLRFTLDWRRELEQEFASIRRLL